VRTRANAERCHCCHAVSLHGAVTWIIGLTGLSTCGALAGDVRVTSTAGHSFDGVQKVHLVTPSAAVGFAGSVRFGLRAVEDMKQYAAAEGVTDFRGGIEGWARRVRYAWQRDSDVTKSSDLHLLVVTAWPKPDADEANAFLGVTLAETSAYVLRSPDFAVEGVPHRRAVSIGSGRAYDRLTEQLSSIEGEIEGLTNFELQPWAATTTLRPSPTAQASAGFRSGGRTRGPSTRRAL